MVPAAKPGGLRIAYLCDFTPLDPNLYSGGNARIHAALVRHAGDVTIIDPGWGPAEPLRRAILALPEPLSIRLRWRAQIALAPLIGRHVSRLLRDGAFDVLFCAYSFQSLLGLSVPPETVVAFTADATPSIYRRSVIGRRYGSYFRISRLADPLIRAAEARALGRADLLLWPSAWLRDRAEASYRPPAGRAVVLPWGANIDHPPAPATPPHLAPGAPVHLLFLGRNWISKGGPETLAILQALRSRGIDARLRIIGCDPPEARGMAGVRVLGSLDKSVPAQRALFDETLAGAHFLVMPSYESFGFAFCEASAMGLPSLCWQVGGIPVETGVNGHALTPGAGPEAFADVVARYLDAPDRYQALRQSSRARYEEALNWDAWGRQAAALLARAVVARRAVSDLSPTEPPEPFSTGPEGPYRTTG